MTARRQKSGVVLATLVMGSALVTVACSPAATVAPTGSAPTPTTASTPAVHVTPGTALQGGLELRPAMPALIDGELDPCLPLCRTGVARPGAITAGERYQTRWFAGGYMTLTFHEPWTILEDGTGALDIVLPEEEAKAPPGEVPYHVGFVLDAWPAKNGKRVDGVPSTSAAIEAWFRGDENFRVLRAEDRTIGVLPARAIDVGLSAQAPEQYPDCGAPCVDTLSFEQLDALGGIRGKDVYRFYFADISFGGESHLLSVEVQAGSLEHLDSSIPRVEAILDTVLLPVRSAY